MSSIIGVGSSHRNGARVRRSVALVLGFVLLCSLVTIPSAARGASGDYGTISVQTPQRKCGDTRCGSLRSIPVNTKVRVWCWRDGGSYKGTPRWFRVRYKIDGWVSAADMDPQPRVPYCSSMKSGEIIYSGQTVWSQNGQFRLIMQGDGNLVLYKAGTPLWATRTRGSGYRAVMQGDGNFVVYASDGKPKWSSGTFNPGSRLVVQDDSNLVIYAGSTALYASSWHRKWGRTVGYNEGVAGNCTWYALERMKRAQGAYPDLRGDAHFWNTAAAEAGWRVQSRPGTHSIVVFEKNVQGSGALGHVAWVDGIKKKSDGLYIHVKEMNFVGLYKTSSRWVKHVSGMSYIMARQR